MIPEAAAQREIRLDENSGRDDATVHEASTTVREQPSERHQDVSGMGPDAKVERITAGLGRWDHSLTAYGSRLKT